MSTSLLNQTCKEIILEAAGNLDSESVCHIDDDGWKNNAADLKTVVCVPGNANGTQPYLNLIRSIPMPVLLRTFQVGLSVSVDRDSLFIQTGDIRDARRCYLGTSGRVPIVLHAFH